MWALIVYAFALVLFVVAAAIGGFHLDRAEDLGFIALALFVLGHILSGGLPDGWTLKRGE